MTKYKKILISHRGNVIGENKEWENHPNYIQLALDEGYDVEVDIWFKDNLWYLGHDSPQHIIEYSYLINPRFWIHCKNYDAMKQLIYLNSDINFFYHSTDPYTLTSKGFIWAYPNQFGSYKTIAVLPELYHTDVTKFEGICSDYIQFYRDLL